MSPADTPAPRVAVWDVGVRVLHWTLVVTVAAAWLTTDWFVRWHQPIGYVALAAVMLRLLLGVRGSRYARFRQFARGPRAALAYARRLLRHDEPRYIGHNPLGGWMALVLLACVAGACVTGWLYTTDWFWGDEVVDYLHQGFAWAFVALVPLHVAGAVFTGWRHRENLVCAMFDGRKAAPRDGDID